MFVIVRVQTGLKKQPNSGSHLNSTLIIAPVCAVTENVKEPLYFSAALTSCFSSYKFTSDALNCPTGGNEVCMKGNTANLCLEELDPECWQENCPPGANKLKIISKYQSNKQNKKSLTTAVVKESTC